MNMFNRGGIVVEVEHGDVDEEPRIVQFKVKGAGELLAFSSEKPKRVCVNGVDEEFEWVRNGELRMELSWEGGECGVSDVAVAY